MNDLVLSLPSDHDTAAAQTAIGILRGVLLAGETTIQLRSVTSTHGVEVVLPAEALQLLLRVLTHMANGSAVTVLPVEAEPTTQQAADLLCISWPYLVRLLDEGAIPFHEVGTHRRVRAADVIAYREQRQA